MCKQHWRLCKNILGLCKGAISQTKLFSPQMHLTQLKGPLLNRPFHLVLIGTFYWSFTLLTCKFVCLSGRCWKVKATARSNKAIMSRVVCSAIHSFHSTISPFIWIPSEAHDVVWNQGINRDLGPACSRTLILGVPAKVPEQIKS